LTALKFNLFIGTPSGNTNALPDSFIPKPRIATFPDPHIPKSQNTNTPAASVKASSIYGKGMLFNNILSKIVKSTADFFPIPFKRFVRIRTSPKLTSDVSV
jgi:hypothetical protein